MTHEATPETADVTDDVVRRLRAAGCVFAEDEARLLVAQAGSPDELAALVDRRAGGEPLEQVLGWAELCGLRFVVEPGVFVPRRRTEHLVHEASRAAREATAGHVPVVLDLCCGSGAVGAGVAAAVGTVELHAADIDPVAVRCARRNVVAAGGRVYEGDLYGPLPASLRGRIDVLVANAPYVPTEALATMPPEARLHEPRTALDGGADGLDVQRRVAARAAEWLAPGGVLLIETSTRQCAGTVEAVTAGGLTATATTDDELDGTVVVGRRSTSGL